MSDQIRLFINIMGGYFVMLIIWALLKKCQASFVYLVIQSSVV